MILLDTHVLIWTIEGDSRLGSRAKSIIDVERSKDGAWFSPVTAWEASMLMSKGKLVLGRALRDWFDAVLAAPGFSLAGVTVAIGVDAGGLQGGIHGDPADRLIVATARALGCPVLTADRKILSYAAAGHVQAIDARR